MTPNPTRAVALGVVYRDGEVLVARHRDPETGDPFYQPIGGGVEFGEHSWEAVVREFTEDLDATFLDPSNVVTYEEIFCFDGEHHHKVWRLYEGEFE